MLKVEGLSKRYLGLAAVDDFSFEVEDGAVVGLIGPNGSGKSTSIDCISGFQRADGGRWFLGGHELTGLAPHRIAQAGLTRTFQTVRAYDELTLLENLCVAMQENDGIGWLQALARGAPLKRADAAATTRAHDLLETVGLSEYAQAPAAILSYGQRKLLAIAASMMARPKLVVLDEPVAGVNPTMIRRIEDVIRKLNAEGVTLVVVEHNVDFIMNLCSRVVVLESGQKIAEGPPALIRSDPRVLAGVSRRLGRAAWLNCWSSTSCPSAIRTSLSSPTFPRASSRQHHHDHRPERRGQVDAAARRLRH
jgi:branched-chain amino acid transport system ATP-binding protein